MRCVYFSVGGTGRWPFAATAALISIHTSAILRFGVLLLLLLLLLLATSRYVR